MEGCSTLERWQQQIRSHQLLSEVLGTTSAVVNANRDSTSATRWSSSARYGGASPCWQRYSTTMSRNVTRCPEHRANASNVEVEARSWVNICVTQRLAVLQHLEPTVVYPTDEQEGKLALHHRSLNVTAPVTQWVTKIDRLTDRLMLRFWR